MKILVLSDTHGNTANIIEYLQRAEQFDKLVHLGDNTEDGRNIASATGIEAILIKGNCDYSDEINPEEQLLEIEGVHIFATHGHNYGVKRDLTSIFYRGKEVGADMVLFGHTHISLSIEHEGISLFNPGSSSEPRLGMEPSVGILNISNGRFEKKIVNL